MTTTATLIEEDCQILMDRAFLGKTACAFGEDGFGKHGRHEQARWFNVQMCDVIITCDDEEEPTSIEGTVSLVLEGYDSSVVGHIMTDRNFEICARAFLKNAQIDPDVIQWPETMELQGRDFVTFTLNVPLLIGWS